MINTYGSSIYAAVRQYVSKHNKICAVLVLNMPVLVEGGGFLSTLRCPIGSESFLATFGNALWAESYTLDDRIGAMIPIGTWKYSSKSNLPLTDLNGVKHDCVVEVFTQGHQVFVLIHAVKTLTAKTIILPHAV